MNLNEHPDANPDDVDAVDPRTVDTDETPDYVLLELGDGEPPELDEPPQTTAQRLTDLQRRARTAQDLAGWASPSTQEGLQDMASAIVELGRVTAELIAVLRAKEA